MLACKSLFHKTPIRRIGIGFVFDRQIHHDPISQMRAIKACNVPRSSTPRLGYAVIPKAVTGDY